jgi:hypothetical protein
MKYFALAILLLATPAFADEGDDMMRGPQAPIAGEGADSDPLLQPDLSPPNTGAFRGQDQSANPGGCLYFNCPTINPDGGINNGNQ